MNTKEAVRVLRILRAAWNPRWHTVRIHQRGSRGFVALRFAARRRVSQIRLNFPDVAEIWRSREVDLRGRTPRSRAGQWEEHADRFVLSLPKSTWARAEYAIAERVAAWARAHPGARDLPGLPLEAER